MEENRETTEQPKKEKSIYVDLANLFGPPAHVMEKYIQNCEDDIERVRKEQELCRNCRDGKCRQPVPEMVHIFTGYRGYPYFPLTPCPKVKMLQRKKLYEEQKAAAGIPDMYQGKGFDDYQVSEGNQQAVRMAQELVRGKDVEKGMYIYGSRGTGKTFLSSVVGNLFLQQGKKVMFATTGWMRYLFRNNARNPDQQDRSLENVDLLIMDNLGSERFSAWGLEQLERVIDARYMGKKLTIVTTNYGLKTLGEKMAQVIGNPDKHDRDVAERICSRLAGMTMPALLYGLDRRKMGEGKPGMFRKSQPAPMELFAKA